ncbi:MAG TPA: LuxR C-terminal-related transcriptional regulator [Terriglobales bacterium]|jgi:DNA-binding NarL/FixJ family response regulator|nr:LuxR C-terminal-related transcriptional regulator [Terriglobales bacterium]
MGELRPFDPDHRDESERKRRALLTPREQEVYPLLAKSIKEIASALGITERTARAHVENISHKLGVSRRIEIVGKDWPKSQ